MNFCILIELSKKKISFLCNRSDGGSKFTPFVGDGHALPLAIYCLGNDIQIGQFAIDEAMNQSPYAYTDVFQIMKTVGTYKYKGNEYHYNTLLKNAIEKYLAFFFDNTLIGQQGRLEQNIATMPLCFVFNADVDENERLFVKDCFEKGGYGNLATIDYDQIVVEASSFTTNHAVCVTSDGNDLFISLYETKTHKYLGSCVMRDKGKDPRVDTAVDKLWESLGYENYYLKKENELPILTQIAENFLSSGELELQENVLFSDGYTRECFLSMRELNNFRYNDDGKIIIDLKDTLGKLNISPLDCTVVLKGKAANNGYFKHIFNGEFNSLINVNDSFHSKVLSQLLKDIKAKNYTFNKVSSVAPPVNPPTSVTTALKRYVKTKIADIKGKQRNGDTVGSLNLAKALLKELHDKDLTNWDTEIDAIITDLKVDDFVTKGHSQREHINGSPSKPTKNQDVSEPQTQTVDSKKFQKEVRITLANVKGKIRTGDISGAITCIHLLENKLHKAGIDAFDREIAEIRTLIPISSSPKATANNTKRTKEVVNKASKAESLLLAGKFAEAKKTFAAEGNSEMAQVCSEFIKSKRAIALYKSGIDSAKRNHNKTTISSILRELDRLLRLYKKYEVDTTELEKLINTYNSIQ